MEEVWKDIKFTDTDGTEYDYTGYYQVSNMGEIRSLDRTVEKFRYGKNEIVLIKGKIMSKSISNDYEVVHLSKDNHAKMFRVNRLVAHMFIPNNDKTKTIVNHKDENKTNNHVDNLEWCDIEYNTNYGTGMKRSGETLSKTRQEKHWTSKTCGVVGVNIKTGEVIEFESCKKAMEFLGLKSQSDITKCCKGKRKSCGGYTWSYK